ncbi:MAG: hypothetical protein SGPRY_010576, partial [Prymnesium sp.]
VATSGKIWVHDCTTISSLDLILFGAEPQILHAQHRVIIDGWIDLRVAPRTAVLCKAMRAALLALMAQHIKTLPADEPSAPPTLRAQPSDAITSGEQSGVLQAIVWLIARGTATGEVEEGGRGGAAAGKGAAMGRGGGGGKVAAVGKGGGGGGKGGGRR